MEPDNILPLSKSTEALVAMSMNECMGTFYLSESIGGGFNWKNLPARNKGKVLWIYREKSLSASKQGGALGR
jgi:hypothetical protein